MPSRKQQPLQTVLRSFSARTPLFSAPDIEV
jgi:hypothetical protein